MRSSILFASALVASAVARPHLNPYLRNHRVVNVVTEVAVETVYVVVTVTAGEEQATSTSTCISTTAIPTSTPCTRSSSSAFRQPPFQTPAPENRLKPEEKPKPELEPSPKSHVSSMSSSFSLESKPLSTLEPSSKAAPVPSPALSSTLKPDKLESSSEVAATPSSKPAPAPSPPLESKPAFTPSSAPNPDLKPTLTPAASSAPPTPEPSSDGHIRGPAEAFLSSGPEYVSAMLYHHNAARENHGAEPLTWDDACEANARIAAEKCNFAHYIPDGAGQGQNLFTVSGRAFNATAGVTESWYKGELKSMMPWFGQPDIPDDVFHEVGHLTQIVWKDTNKVGCVSVDCGNKMIVGGRISTMSKYTVCNYAPAGNVYGAYASNVAGPTSNSNLGGWAD